MFQNCFDRASIYNVEQQIRELIRQDTTSLGELIRLAYHDCVERCDGYITNNHPKNAGKPQF